MNKISTLKYSIAAILMVMVSYFSYPFVISMVENHYEPILIFKSRLVLMSLPDQKTPVLWGSILMFENNVTVDFEDYRSMVYGLQIGQMYTVYQCWDGGYRIMGDYE